MLIIREYAYSGDNLVVIPQPDGSVACIRPAFDLIPFGVDTTLPGATDIYAKRLESLEKLCHCGIDYVRCDSRLVLRRCVARV